MCAIDQVSNGLRGLIQDGCQGGRSKLKGIHGCHDMAKDTSASYEASESRRKRCDRQPVSRALAGGAIEWKDRVGCLRYMIMVKQNSYEILTKTLHSSYFP
jgi:hypothetical protein